MEYVEEHAIKVSLMYFVINIAMMETLCIYF